MGDPSATLPKKFKTELTDYSIRHESNTGPYADNLDVDVIIVGGGFSKYHKSKSISDYHSDMASPL